MTPEIHAVPESAVLASTSRRDETVPASANLALVTSSRGAREPFRRFRRSRPDAHAASGELAAEDELALQLQVMLLSEENARLKTARHRPSDVGTLIDQVRELGGQESPGEILDDAWSMLSECLVIRQGLEQAWTELDAAIDDVRDRLGSLTLRLDGTMPDHGGQLDVGRRQSSPAR